MEEGEKGGGQEGVRWKAGRRRRLGRVVVVVGEGGREGVGEGWI